MYRYMAAENVRVRVFRITTHANILADALSRGDTRAYFRAAAAWIVPTPTEVWEARVFKNPPLLEQAAARFREGRAIVSDGQAVAFGTTCDTTHDDVLFMHAEVPSIDSEEYHALFNATYEY